MIVGFSMLVALAIDRPAIEMLRTNWKVPLCAVIEKIITAQRGTFPISGSKALYSALN